MMVPMSTDDDLLFAEHVVKAGFLTKEEVDESLSVQRRMAEMGVHDTLRNVLVKRRVLREGDAAVVARNAGLRSGGEPIPGYTLEARLGSGAMGSVYKAFQKGMKRHVAMKILRRDLTDDPRQVERLQREAALVGKLDHPHIVRGLDSGESDGLVWFVMELVDGETLRERITRLGRIPHDEAVRLTRQVAEALDHAATHGIVHRDVKPGNILVAKDGTPRLTDYGLAKGETDDALTQLDATLGTPQYISPEQARNPRDADIRSDIYSLGATLYAMLTGHPPFAGETMAATLTKVLYERPEPLAKDAPDTPPALAYVVERMMAKDRKHRYQTPAELLHDLRALEEGRLVVPAGFKGDISEFVETRRHRRLWFAGAGLVAAAVALAAVVFVWEQRTADERRRDAAAHELASLRQLAGPEAGWNGETVQRMLQGYERIGRDHAGTPAATEALKDVERWTRQSAELQRAQLLALRAGDAPSDWPRLLAEIDTLLSEMRDVPDASVARRRLAELRSDVRERRDRHARQESANATAAATAIPSIADAGTALDSVASALRTKYFGDERSELVDDARTAAAGFREAAVSLDRAFAPYERPALKEGGLERGEFRTLAALLETTVTAARRDERLPALLAALPPQGTRSGAIDARRDVLHSQLADACATAWEKVRADAEDKRSRREWESAAEALAEFAGRAMDSERESALKLRESMLRLHEGADTTVKRDADETAARFFEALGRRDYAQARETLDMLAPVAASARSASNPAADFVAGGTKLLDLVERLLWAPLRTRLAKGPPFERDLSVRSGQGYLRYPGIKDVRIADRDLSFTLEGGQIWKGSIYDLALDDVVFYAGLSPNDPERALVIAAVRLAEHVPPSDPVEGVRVLTDMAPVLDAARGSAALAPMTQRVARLRDELLGKARELVMDIEQRVEQKHRDAITALNSGNYDEAYQHLQQLLDVKSFWRSEYVKAHREEIGKQKESAALGRQQANYAAHFPAGTFRKSADGSGEIFFDFESAALASADVRRRHGLVDGRTEVASRPAVVADRPGLVHPDGAQAVPLVLEHVLAWRPAEGSLEPRDFPVTVDCPFAMRTRISVSFLYRSDTPFFFAVSVGGVTAGVLSAPEDKYNGRGISIWNARTLDRPDKEFEDRYRSSYLAKHVEALRKEGDKRFFYFEPGRTYRVEFVKDERKASLWVDGQLRLESDWRPVSGPLDGKITLTSFSAAEVDDLRITGTLDPEWLRGR
jgi:tRNA A-37 threonylcarbamoyl transferase component Bud32